MSIVEAIVKMYKGGACVKIKRKTLTMQKDDFPTVTFSNANEPLGNERLYSCLIAIASPLP